MPKDWIPASWREAVQFWCWVGTPLALVIGGALVAALWPA